MDSIERRYPVFIRLLLAGFLVAHAAIHVAFLTPVPPATASGPSWPFSTSGSWVVTRLGIEPDTARVLALALIALTCARFGLAALVAVGVLASGMWVPALVVGSVASLGLLVVFFHPWLVLGMAIDLALLWVSLAMDWSAGPPTPAL